MGLGRRGKLIGCCYNKFLFSFFMYDVTFFFSLNFELKTLDFMRKFRKVILNGSIYIEWILHFGIELILFGSSIFPSREKKLYILSILQQNYIFALT